MDLAVYELFLFFLIEIDEIGVLVDSVKVYTLLIIVVIHEFTDFTTITLLKHIIFFIWLKYIRQVIDISASS